MAVIMRVEVVNYLCEGWQPSLGVAKWKPLWPANTLHLCGQSTAIQLPNGGGKTSVTNGILFLLSRDRHLKAEFLDRCAPVEAGYTHLRIEFAMRGDDDLLQRDLITADPAECPAKTYVIGVCGNRGDEDLMFYRYPGTLEDAPTYSSVAKTFVFTPNDVFRNSVKKLPKSDWNRWSSVAEWNRAISEFVPTEVVRQNVSFHRRGAGDASATFEKFTVEQGERFDEAFFKQVVAPQLLLDVMGDSAQEDERAVEDTITISMTRFIDAKLSVEKKQAYIARRAELESEFEPVVTAANAIHTAVDEYQRQLMQLGRDASFLQRFAKQAQTSIPGVPRDLASARLADPVRALIAAMVIDSDGNVLVADAGLAKLLEMTTGHLNQSAERVTTAKAAVPSVAPSSQVIDLYCDIKTSEGSGGRQKAVRYYDHKGAMELVSRAGRTEKDGLTLDQSFDDARRLIDTNVFRHEHRRLGARAEELAKRIEAAESKVRTQEAMKDSLEKQVTQRADNHAAYQEFCSQSALMPDHLKDEPAGVERWLSDEISNRDRLLMEHGTRVGRLTRDWDQWQAIQSELGLTLMSEQLAQFNAQNDRLIEEEGQALEDKKAAEAQVRALAEAIGQNKASLEQTRRLMENLAVGAEHDRKFRRIFGDVEPSSTKPPVEELRQLQKDARTISAGLAPKRASASQLHTLAPFIAEFRSLFGDVDPTTCHPRADRDQLEQRQRDFETSYATHVPFAEALELHLELHKVAPGDWMAQTDLSHSEARRRVVEQGKAVEIAEREIAALDDLRVLEEVDYEQAHAMLLTAGVPFKRLRDLILETKADPGRRLPLLAAFGPFLGAPVVADFATAEVALAVIAKEGLNIPVFLREPLAAALATRSGHESEASAAAGFLVGSKTRRIRAIVDPQALADERAEWVKKLGVARFEVNVALKMMSETSPQTDDYRRALKAVEALNQQSVRKVAEAEKGMKEIAPALKAVLVLTTEAALRALSKASEYQKLGGAQRADELAAEIRALEEEVSGIDRQIDELAPKTTSEAIVAHDGAVKFSLAGGQARLEAVGKEESRLAATSLELTGRLDGEERRLVKAARLFSDIGGERKKFAPIFDKQTTRLAQSIAFAAGSDLTFMREKDSTEAELTRRRKALEPLQRVNLSRAQSYKDLKGDDETSLHRKIGEAVQARNEAAEAAKEAHKTLEKLGGELDLANRNARALHELAFSLVSRLASVAPFLKDLAAREIGQSPVEVHGAYVQAEELRHRLQGWRAEQGPFDLTAIAAVRYEVDEIDIAATGAKTKESQRLANRARDQFQATRTAFCLKARQTQGRAMAEAEIEAIEAANTTEELRELSKLGDRLRSDLATEQANFEELQLSAQTVESESVSILAKLVDSCRTNFATMNKVMGRNPNARFFLEATIIGEDDIKKLLISLRDGIEERKRAAQSTNILGRKDKQDASIRADVRTALIERIFLEPSVQFRHIGMWEGDTRPVQSTLSEGQKAALQMMWLIKESEYHLECTVRKHLGGGSRKKLRDRSQRIMFFDGLFSNLSDRTLIDEAFKGLGELGGNLQLVGLIHNDNYRNNEQIFPSYLIGRRAGWRNVEGERTFIQFEDGRADGSIGFATFIVKPPVPAARLGDANG